MQNKITFMLSAPHSSIPRPWKHINKSTYLCLIRRLGVLHPVQFYKKSLAMQTIKNASLQIPNWILIHYWF